MHKPSTTQESDRDACHTGYEVRTSNGRGEGVYATRGFAVGDTVMTGRIECAVDGNHSHASQVALDRFVLHSGLVSKVNHSCEPNCGIHVNDSGAHDFVAHRAIALDDEVTFDYAMRNYVIEHFPAVCGCGATACRRTITGWKDLPDQRKRDYVGLVAPYLTRIDAATSTARVR